MPPQRSASLTIRYTYTIALILLLGKIMPSYSCYKEKKLVYIAIATPLSAQPSSYSKYTQLNIQLFCNCIITAPVVPTTCLRVRYVEYAFTRSVHQPPAYASGAPLEH